MHINRIAAGGVGQENMPTLVLDNGADRLKVGFAGDPAPRLLMPNCTGKLKGQLQVSGMVVGGMMRLAETEKSLSVYALAI
eukprot:evm.model.NODE_22100_length_8472_cov_16.101274.2